MKIVYLGSGEFGIDCLDAIAASNHNLDFIVTQPSQPAGRGRRPKPTAVADWAERHKIAFTETDDVNSPGVFDKIAVRRPELIVVIAFGQKIGTGLVNLPAKGAINVHSSLLPKYRGAAPINRAIINGEKQTGVSIITLAEKMDAGDILAQTKTDILQNETAGELHNRLAKLAAPLLLETIDKIAAGAVVYTKQDDSEATSAPKLKKSDGFLDFAESAEALKRRILGFWPWPGASAIYVSKKTGKTHRVTIAMVSVVQSANPNHLPPGTLDENINVICGKDALKILKIKPADGNLMEFGDFANGRATQAGDMFTKINE